VADEEIRAVPSLSCELNLKLNLDLNLNLGGGGRRDRGVQADDQSVSLYGMHVSSSSFFFNVQEEADEEIEAC
jgi:hypothetical protein